MTSAASDDAAALLSATELFANLDAVAIRRIAAAAEPAQVRGGELVFQQGDLSDALYLVAAGRLRAVADRGTKSERVVREMGRGEHFGELGLLTGGRRSTGVQAIRDSKLLRLPADAFASALQADVGAALRLTRTLARWVVDGNRTGARPESVATIALVAADGSRMLDWLADRLASALAEVGATMHLDAPRIAGELGCRVESLADALNDSSHSERFDRIEATHRFVVYSGTPDTAEWVSCCVRQADRVLAVVAADCDPGALRRTFASLLAGAAERRSVELAIVHATTANESRGTARLLEAGSFTRHHHVRVGCDADVERLARALTGGSIGVVLGGGGARGFAHIGVLRALAEAGVPVDLLGGTSMGSVIAAQAAAGASPAEMVEINRIWARWNPLRDLSLPLVALVSGRSGFRLLDQMFAGRHIEDLWLPYFCVSTNLTRSELVVHRQGPVYGAVRASISIPGLFPPVRTAVGDLLVDGGLLNNVPADVMQASGAGRVVAVNVAPVHELAARADFGDHPAAWQVVRSFLTARTIGNRVPSIYRILERATLISSLAHVDRVRDRVDLFLDVPLEAYGTFSWRALEEIVRRGYEWAQPRVEAWQLGLQAASRDGG